MPEKKRLYRSRDEKMIGGVAGGLGDYFGVEPTLVRLAFLVLLLAEGAGLWIYIAAWIIMPEAPATEPKNVTPPANDAQKDDGEAEPHQDLIGNVREQLSNPKNSPQQLFGLILIGLGAIFLLQPLFGWLDLSELWPLILVAIGAAIVLRR